MDRFRELEILVVWALCAACMFALFAAPPARAARRLLVLGAPAAAAIEAGKR